MYPQTKHQYSTDEVVSSGMYRKILVPLDGSELAELALPYAEEMAGRFGSKLTLLHVSQSAEDPREHLYQSYFEKVSANIRSSAERYLTKDNEGIIHIITKTLTGHPAEQIVDYSEREVVDLIIMATHGRSGVRRWTLGSVADKVIRGTKQPVLLIRAGSPRPRELERSMLNRILVPLDGSEISEAIIPYVEELSRRLDSELFLIVVEDADFCIAPEDVGGVAKDYLENISNQLGLKGINTKINVRSGIAAEKIIDFADEIGADAIAMGTHGRSGVRRWIFGSVASKVLHEATLPLLIVRPPGF